GGIDRGAGVLRFPCSVPVLPRAPDVRLAEAARPIRTEIQPAVRGRPREPFLAPRIHRLGQASRFAPFAIGLPVDAPDIQVLVALSVGGTRGDEIEELAIRCDERVGLNAIARETLVDRRVPTVLAAVADHDAPAAEVARTPHEIEIIARIVERAMRLEQWCRDRLRRPVRGWRPRPRGSGDAKAGEGAADQAGLAEYSGHAHGAFSMNGGSGMLNDEDGAVHVTAAAVLPRFTGRSRAAQSLRAIRSIIEHVLDGAGNRRIPVEYGRQSCHRYLQHDPPVTGARDDR